jgi:hypothetical protein
MIRSPAVFGVMAVSLLAGCAGDKTPSGPRRLVPPG